MRLRYCAYLCGNVQWHLQLHSSVQRFDIAFFIKRFGFCGALFERSLAWKQDISKRLFLEWNCFSPCRPAILLKKRLRHRCFPLNFVKLLRTLFLQNTSGWLLLVLWNFCSVFSFFKKIVEIWKQPLEAVL